MCPWLFPGTDRWRSDLREAAFPHPPCSTCPSWISPATCHVTPVEHSGLHYPERASANAGEDLKPREPLVGMGNGCAPGRSVPVRLPQDDAITGPMHIEMSTTRRTSVPCPPELRLPLYLTLSLLRPAPPWFAGPIGHSWRKHAVSRASHLWPCLTSLFFRLAAASMSRTAPVPIDRDVDRVGGSSRAPPL